MDNVPGTTKLADLGGVGKDQDHWGGVGKDQDHWGGVGKDQGL